MGPPVWVTGMGALSCVGVQPEDLWQSAFKNQTGIISGLGEISESLMGEIRFALHSSPFKSYFSKIDNDLPKSKAALFSLYALTEAMRNAQWSGLNSDDGLILATTTGLISIWDREFHLYQPLGALLKILCDELSFKGRNTLITSACSASSQAIALGSLWLKQGRVKRVLVGGSEVLCDLTVEGFRSLQLLSSEPTLPFDQNRKGINLSEGAGFLCLESKWNESHPPLAEISGFGLATDGFHMTSPHPLGRGCREAMKLALNQSRINPAEIDWVHAHGTGSFLNDQAEGHAIADIFGKETPWVSSTKWVHGHTLGASGVIETILCILALKEQVVLKTGGMKNADPLISVRHPTEHHPQRLNHILKNTLGFGGANASLVISRALKNRATPEGFEGIPYGD